MSLTITATPDFDLTLLPNSVTIQQGNSGVVTLQAGSLNNFNQPITLSASGLPAGVSVSFTPTTLTPTATGSLQVAVGAQVTPNTYQLTVTGIGGGITRQANLQLTVTLDSGTGSWQQLALGDIGALYYGAVVGDVGNTGQQRVYGTAADGVVYEYAFDGTSWSFSQVQVGVSADGEMHNGFIGPGREDGVNRLYIVAFNGNRLYEVTWANSSWQVAVVDSNIVGALDVDIGDGRNDGHTTVYATGDNAVYEYHWNGSGWDRTIISSSNGGHGLDLGPGRDDGVNRLYAGHLNGEIFEYTWTGSQWTSQLVANVGDIRGVEVGVGRNDGVQRLYAAAGNGNVYEFTWTGSSWQQVTLPGTGPGGLKVETILSPARGDGLVRIYVPAANGGIYEYGWTGSAWQSDLLGLANSYMYGAAAGDGLNNGGVQVYGASYDGNLYLFEFG